MNALRRGWVPLLAAAVVGGVLGYLAAGQGADYRSTAVLSVRGSDVGLSATQAESAASAVTSDAVIASASQSLGMDAGTLAARTSASVQRGTTLIDIEVTGPTPGDAIRGASAVSTAVITAYRERGAAVAEQVRTAGQELLTQGKLDAATAEAARQDRIGSVVGAAQGDSIEGDVALVVASPAQRASVAGLGATVAALLGAVAGVLLVALALLAGAGRRWRRVRTITDCEDAGPWSAVLPASAMDHIAGRVLESQRRTVVMAGERVAPERMEGLAAQLSGWLMRSGTSVAVLNSVVPSELAAALPRSARENAADRLGVDVVVMVWASTVAVGSDEGLSLLAGQSDYLPIVVVGSGVSMEALRAARFRFAEAGPIAVLASR